MTKVGPIPLSRRGTAPSSTYDLIVRDGPSVAHQVAVFAIFIIIFVAALSIARPVFLPIAAAFVLGLLFGPLQSKLEKLGVPSMLGATVIVASLVGAILFTIRMLIIPFEEWSARLPDIWEAIRRQMYAIRDLIIAVNDATDMMQESAGLGDGSGGAETVVLSTQGLLGSIATGVPSAAAQIVLFLGVLFFFLASRTRLRVALLSLCFGRKARLKAAHCIADAETAVSSYLTNIAMINAGLGLVTGTILWLLGVPNAWFWGALAALVNFFPYIGPAALTILLLGVGLLDEGVGIRPFLPAIVFFTLNFIEANFVTPSILGRNMTVEPMLVIIALAFWLWLWGPVGALLAVPLLVVGQAVTHRLLLRDGAWRRSGQRGLA